MVGKTAAAIAAMSLVASPVMASTASSLSVAGAQRASAPAGDESRLGGMEGGSIVAAILAAAIVVGGVIIAVDGGSDSPVSR